VSISILADRAKDEEGNYGQVIDVKDLRIVMLRSGLGYSRAVVCRLWYDVVSHEAQIGNDNGVICRIDNRCPPKGKAQAYRVWDRGPEEVVERESTGQFGSVRYTEADKHLVSAPRGNQPFSLRINHGWVQLVVGKFQPMNHGKKEAETDMPHVAYAFPISCLMDNKETGEGPAITLNIMSPDDNVTDEVFREKLVAKISKLNATQLLLDRVIEISSSIAPKTVLATVNRKVAVAVGMRYYDSFPGGKENASRVEARRPETPEVTSVINKMAELQNPKHRLFRLGDPSTWALSLLVQVAEATDEYEVGDLVSLEIAREKGITAFSDDTHSEDIPDGVTIPRMFLDCSEIDIFWCEAAQGCWAAILPPITVKDAPELQMNGILVSLDVCAQPPGHAVAEVTKAIKPDSLIV
jgi:hypothetical protein